MAPGFHHSRGQGADMEIETAQQVGETLLGSALDLWQSPWPRSSAAVWAVAIAAAALVLRRLGLGRGRAGMVTWLHEAGHALGALAVGYRLHGLHVHGDGSGLTRTSGRQSRWRRTVISAAGYPAPAWAGALLTAAVLSGRAGAALILAGVASLILLPWSRSWRAAALPAGLVAVAGLAMWRPPAGGVALFVSALLGGAAVVAILGGFGDWWAERRARHRGMHTDVVTLATLTGLPAGLCWAGLGVLTAAAPTTVAVILV